MSTRTQSRRCDTVSRPCPRNSLEVRQTLPWLATTWEVRTVTYPLRPEISPDSLRTSQSGQHSPGIRNRRCSDRSCKGRRSRHRLQRHHGLPDRIHGAPADIHDRVRRPVNQRHPEPRRLGQTLPPIRHLAQCQFPRRERQHLLIACGFPLRLVPNQ